MLSEVRPDDACRVNSDGSVELCTWTPPKQSIREGDAGGPQIRRGGQTGELVGVASREANSGPASDCDGASVFTDAVVFRDWIATRIRS